MKCGYQRLVRSDTTGSSLRELVMGVALLAAVVLAGLRPPALPGEVDLRAYNRSAPAA
jgi:hypothetical protein